MKVFEAFPRYPLDFLLFEIVEFFEGQDQTFKSRGLTFLHYRSTILLSTIMARLDSKDVTYNEAHYVFVKWLCTITVRTPEYLIAINAAYNDFEYEVNSRKSLFQQIIIDCGFLEIAYEAIGRIKSPSDYEATTLTEELLDITQRQNGKSQSEGNKRTFKHKMSDKQIEVLFDKLIDGNFISPDTTIDSFKELFSNSSSVLTQPIKWTSKTVLLVYLLYKLDTRYELIFGKWQTHFGDKRKAFISQKDIPISSSTFSTYVSSIVTDDFPERIAAYHKKITPILEAVKGSKS